MTQHNPLPVSGYSPQSADNVGVVNINKELEERVLRQIDEIQSVASDRGWDGRWAAIARTNIEQGFMALNRAIFRPGRVPLPEDVE